MLVASAIISDLLKPPEESAVVDGNSSDGVVAVELDIGDPNVLVPAGPWYAPQYIEIAS
jgi:hypothetical protein